MAMRIEQIKQKIEQLADENFKLNWHQDQAAFAKLMINVRDIEILENELWEISRRNRIHLVRD